MCFYRKVNQLTTFDIYYLLLLINHNRCTHKACGDLGAATKGKESESVMFAIAL